jgi:ABC-type antimicrobial peptide transport system permease subunit
LIYGAVLAGAAGVGFLANMIPARRASNIDPVRALHDQ